jgi:hypothetical protein
MDDEKDHWVIKEESLPPLLQMLHSVCFFSLRSETFYAPVKQLDWSEFPADLQSSLFDLLQTPHVTNISLEGISFPVTLLNSLSYLKRLHLCAVSVTSYPILGPPIYASSFSRAKGHLQALRIMAPRCPNDVLKGYRRLVDALNHPDALLGISRLRELNCDICDDEVLEVGSQVIKVAAQSLLFLALDICEPTEENTCMFKSVHLRWLKLIFSQHLS